MRTRYVTAAVAGVVVLGGGLGGALLTAPRDAATDLQIEDTGGVLIEDEIAAAVDDVRFYAPTTVAVFTILGEGSSADDRALNDAVLAHAREERPDWLSADGNDYADGLYLVAIDPESRLVGTYTGEDRVVGTDTELAIQDSMREDLRAGMWTDATITGIEAGADVVGRPILRSGPVLIVAALVGVALLVGAAWYVVTGSRRVRASREARAEGDRAMAEVVGDLDDIDLHVGLIPEDSEYGGLVLRKHREYTRGFRELTELGNRARGVPESAYDEEESVAVLTEYRDTARRMNGLAGTIADTAALLNRDNAWPQAWARQVDPVLEDLARVEPVLAGLPAEVRGSDAAGAARAFAAEAETDVTALRGDLEHERLTPDAALDRLREVRLELTRHLDALASVVTRQHRSNERKRRAVGAALGASRRSQPVDTTILGVAAPAGMTFFSVAAFQDGVESGRGSSSAATHSSDSAGTSSGGSITGYTPSSGGGFSGSGSSSRF